MTAAASVGVGLSRIGQIAMTVQDVSRAVAFYRDVLGLRPLFQAPRLAFFECGGIRIMLSPPETPEFDHAASIIYYRVDDIRAAHEILKKRGVPFDGEPHLIARMPDHELWMAFCRDPEGNVLALMSEVRGS